MDTVAIERTDQGAPTHRISRIWLYAAVAVLLPMITSSVYYIVTNELYLTLRGLDPNTPPPVQVWAMVGQLIRNAVVVGVLLILMRRAGVTTPTGALRFGLLVWLGFQAMAVAGSVLHEQYPMGLYLLHVGDALQATLIMAMLLSRALRRDAS